MARGHDPEVIFAFVPRLAGVWIPAGSRLRMLVPATRRMTDAIPGFEIAAGIWIGRVAVAIGVAAFVDVDMNRPVEHQPMNADDAAIRQFPHAVVMIEMPVEIVNPAHSNLSVLVPSSGFEPELPDPQSSVLTS